MCASSLPAPRGTLAPTGKKYGLRPWERQAARLTHGGFYAHFASREAMLAEAADRAGQEGLGGKFAFLLIELGKL